MRAVNLLPRQHVEQRSDSSTNVVALVSAIGGGAVVVALAGGFLLASHSVDKQRDALESAKAQLALTPARTVSAAASQSRATLLGERERRAVALASALSKRVSWDRVLRRLALVIPDDVWLTDLTGSTPLTSDAPAAGSSTPSTTTSSSSSIPATPSGLTIEGYTYSQDAVARLLSRLAVVPDLKNVQLQTSKVDELGGRKIIKFTILSDIWNGGEAA